MTENKPGCLGLLLGFGTYKSPVVDSSPTFSDEDEGNIHSGPGGYEGMGYAGGYAADYLNDDDDLEH